jgi:predicted component of type VI protein secretion system
MIPGAMNRGLGLTLLLLLPILTGCQSSPDIILLEVRGDSPARPVHPGEPDPLRVAVVPLTDDAAVDRDMGP